MNRTGAAPEAVETPSVRGLLSALESFCEPGSFPFESLRSDLRDYKQASADLIAARKAAKAGEEQTDVIVRARRRIQGQQVAAAHQRARSLLNKIEVVQW